MAYTEIKKILVLNSLTPEQMAQRVGATEQEVNEWASGKSQPDAEALKVISKEFNISVNTLLGSPKTLICQCCGIPLADDNIISREPDGSFNEDYCMWCYKDGEFVYKTKEDLVEFMVKNLPNPNDEPEEERREAIDKHISQFSHWKQNA